MSANLRIFVSSTCADLFQERIDLSLALLELGHSVTISESPETMPVNPRLSCVENCLAAIENHTDLLCLVISGNYGNTDESGRSITKREFLKAKAMGIPTLAFVRKKVWDLMPVHKNNPTANFLPHVTDNRVFDFIKKVGGENGEGWIFSFTDTTEIISALKYQLSCLLRSSISSPEIRQHSVYHKYANNYSVRLSSEGWCQRSLDYHIVNHSDAPIKRILMGDASDIDINVADMNLKAQDFSGRTLKPEFLLVSPRFKRWELILEKPLEPGGELAYSVSYLSADLGQMQTGHTLPALHGSIRYMFPPRSIGVITEAHVRRMSGWESVFDRLSVHEVNGSTSIACCYGEGSSSFQFRLRWNEIEI